VAGVEALELSRGRGDAVVVVADPSEYAAISALVIDGLVERWGWHDFTLNLDLKLFASFYKDATVLVAKVEHQIVGCGVLIKERQDVGRIVRMSVSKRWRRLGIGSQVLAALLQKAKALGLTQIVLETSADWESATRFYISNGFTPTTVEDGDQHFVLIAGNR
jgi:GNAT superfamily N-acetyltransferase